MDTLGARVRQARELLGMSREALAERLEISDQFLTKIENNERNVSIDNLMKLSRVLCLSADFLLTGHDPPHNSSVQLSCMLNNLTEVERGYAEELLKTFIKAMRHQ